MERVLIITQYFYPENFRINDLAIEMVKKGYKVDALVGIPNYPQGTYYKGYGFFSKRHEVYKGVNIYRCFQFARGPKSSNIRLAINYLSFMISATLWALFKFSFRPKYDAIIAFEPSPITQIIPAVILKKITKTKLLSWIQDIWPDSLGSRANGTIYKVMDKITEFVYSNTDKILISSKDMAPLVCRNNDYSKKIEYTPNWCDDFSKSSNKTQIDVPSGFNLMMAGSINNGLGVDALVDLLEELSKEPEINILFVGDGTQKEYLSKRVKECGLVNTYFLGSFSYDDMGDVYSMADALLITLRKTEKPHLNATVPSRLQAYMSSGKPIFAMIGKGAADIITDAECGFVVPSGSSKELAEVIIRNYKDIDLLRRMGENARSAYQKEFTLSVGVAHFEELIKT